MKKNQMFLLIAIGLLSLLTTQCSDDEKGVLEGTRWKQEGYEDYVKFTADYIHNWEYYEDDDCYDYYHAKYKIENDSLIYTFDNDDPPGEWELIGTCQITNDRLILQFDDDDIIYYKSSFDEDSFEVCDNTKRKTEIPFSGVSAKK